MNEATNRLVLFHGAGSSRDHAELVAIEQSATVACPDLTVDRHNFGYRDAGRKLPGPVPGLVQECVAALEEHPADRLVIGGRSLGGRVASMAVAGSADDSAHARLANVVGLVLIAFPLISRKGVRRDDHFPRITVPTLFIAGSADPFGSPAELAAAAERIPAAVEMATLDGCGHELKGSEPELAALVTSWLRSLPGF